MIHILILADRSQVENPRFRYTLEFLNAHPLNSRRLNFSVLQSSEPDIVIHYGKNTKEDNYYIPAQNEFFSLDNSTIELPTPNHYRFGNHNLISAEGKQRNTQNLIEGKTFQFDLFESIFFHISRYEEVLAKSTDNSEAGWLEEKLHFLVRHKLNHVPVVDQLAAALFEILTDGSSSNSTTYSLSHDVDILTRFTPFLKFVRSLAASIFHARGIKHIKNSICHYHKMLKGTVKDPYDASPFMLRSSRAWKAKTLYFMTGGTSKYDNRYKSSDPQVDIILQEGLSKGYTIGFHPSYNAHIDSKMYKLEKNLIDSKTDNNITTNRQHWLRFSWNETPKLLTENGIKMDSSMGYNNHIGFRCGTGFPYKMYDFERETSYTWIEQPLAFMDSSLLHFCNNTDQSLKDITTLFFTKNQLNTHIEINFHNSNFDPTTDHGQQLKSIYTKYILPFVER